MLTTLLTTLSMIAAHAEEPGHRVLAADRSTGIIAIIEHDGNVAWEYPCKHDVHSLWMLPNGNILTHISAVKTVEISPEKKIVWSYTSKPKPGYDGRVEVHAVQRLDNGNTMIAESGNSRIIEVNPKGQFVKTIPLKVDVSRPHSDTRMVRKLNNGHYLVCQEAEGVVREYDGDGKVVWEYALDLGDRTASPGHGVEGHGTNVYGAIRLKNGNTLIAGGNNNRVLEVTPEKKIVWSIDQKELPGITLAWVTTLHVLKNGNIVIGNCHAGETNPQLIEVTRNKKVVWTFKDFKHFGNNLASAVILDDVMRR